MRLALQKACADLVPREGHGWSSLSFTDQGHSISMLTSSLGILPGFINSSKI